MTIGICDYGIGGIGLYKLLRANTTADIVYFSDAGYTPYGKVSEVGLSKRVSTVIEYFNSLGVQYIAVACNAASTVIPKDKYITGIIEHGVRMVSKIRPKEIGVVGGYRTIESLAYKNQFESLGIPTTQSVAQQLSIRIENGDLNSAELDMDIKTIFESLRGKDHILLACTHYPVIANRISEYIPNAKLLDPVSEMEQWIYANWPKLGGTSSTRWITTGDTHQMKSAARLAFDVILNEIEQISL